jgi:Skp family chaperone for outer membrane proteins
MTRRLIATIVSALLLFVGGRTAAAQNAPAAPAPAQPAAQAPQAPAAFPADAKIAFVSMQFVVSQSKLGKTGQDKMKALTDKQNTERTAKQQELQKLQQEIQTGASVLAPAVLQQKTADLDRLTREAQFQEQQRQVDLENLNNQLLGEFSEQVLPIVEQIRAERNLWMVLTAGDGSNIAAVHPGLDLSAEVVKRLDAAQ